MQMCDALQSRPQTWLFTQHHNPKKSKRRRTHLRAEEASIHKYANDSARDLLADTNQLQLALCGMVNTTTRTISIKILSLCPEGGSEFFIDLGCACNKRNVERSVNHMCKAKVVSVLDYLYYTTPEYCSDRNDFFKYASNPAPFPLARRSRCTPL